MFQEAVTGWKPAVIAQPYDPHTQDHNQLLQVTPAGSKHQQEGVIMAVKTASNQFG